MPLPSWLVSSVADARAKTLARIHRVRTLQLGLTRAHDKAASEQALSTRITGLATAVAPVEQTAVAVSLGASAHYRERLQHSADAAVERVRSAEYQVARATDATRAAQRDQSAVEKLIARAQADAVIRELRALEEAPAVRKIRHDPC
jgi:flagellar FliJ protein